MLAGDVLRIDFGIPVGGGPGFVRPAIVVNAGEYVATAPPTLQVVPVTTNVRRGYPLDVEVAASGLERPSAAQCQLLTVIAREQVVDDELGNVGAASLYQIRQVLGDLLDLWPAPPT